MSPPAPADLATRHTFVSLDLETTGLSPETDDVIEVGAVKFRGGEVLGTFSTLVNPQRPLPEFIRGLTGITQEQVVTAPTFASVAPGVLRFVGSHPLVGHNIAFDLEFLRRKGLRFPGPGYDTLDLASLLLPALPELSLSAVCKALGLPTDRPHRAFNDADMARGAFVKLLDLLAKLDPALVGEMRRIADRSEWPLRHLLRELAPSAETALLQKGEPGLEGVDLEDLASRLKAPEARPTEVRARPDPQDGAGQKRGSPPTVVGAATVRSVLGPGGPLAATLGAFESRPEQVRMAEAVADAFDQRRHLIVEAGTGTGKSLAYLVPAALFAHRTKERVVLSTNTINLQEQLTTKDIPDAVRALRAGGAVPEGQEVRFSLLKGRANYLCLRRWAMLKRGDSLSPIEARTVCKVLLWLQRTATGDRGEVHLTGPEAAVWHRLSAQTATDQTGPCPFVKRGLCFYHAARQRAEAADVLVVNHALLCLDARLGGLLPAFGHLLADEAHNLEEVATNQFGFAVDDEAIDQFLGRIAGGAGALGAGILAPFRAALRAPSLGEGRKGDLAALLGEIDGDVQGARSRLNALFKLLGDFAVRHAANDSDYEVRLTLNRGMRAQPAWSGVEKAWEDANVVLEKLHADLSRLHATAGQLSGLMPNAEDQALEILGVAELGEELRRALASAVASPEAACVYWLTIDSKDGAVTLHSAPLHVGPLLKDRLFDQKETVVLTGATLSTEGTFEYVKERLRIEPASEVLLGSPFDYPRLALVYIPEDMPEPNSPRYQAALERTIAGVARAARGRTMVLFTSRAALRSARKGLQPALAGDGITVLAQGVDGTPRHLINTFKSSPNTVLLGTGSFWEGVDIAGEALSVLVIARLPFSVPTDPVFAARSQQFEDPFSHYAVPQAVLRFRQGFGRLIRRKTDRGVLVILDRRVLSKAYGAAFLESMPRCARKMGPAADLPAATVRWLSQRSLELRV